jgi:hypothetical protein
MTERWQKELRKLRGVEPPEGVWERATTRIPSGDGLPPARQRVVAGAVAFGVFIAAASFAWLAFGSLGKPEKDREARVVRPGGPAAVQIGVIRCRSNGQTVVKTPRVAVQADGVHIRVQETSGAGALMVFPDVWDGGVQTSGFPRGIEDEGDVLAVPAGRARIACDWPNDDDMTSRDELAASVPIEFVNDQGLYHLDELVCPHEDRRFPDDPSLRAYAVGNDHVPLPDVIRRVVPGIRDTDVVDYGGYPQAESSFRSWRVVRNGVVLALIRDPNAFGGTWPFGPIETCEGSGIAAIDSVTAGMTGSPFEIPGFDRCDPYAEECRLAYVDPGTYRALDGADREHGVPYTEDAVVCFEDYVFPVSCEGQPGGTVWLALRMAQETFDAFTSRYGCGSSPADLCTRSDVR